MCVRLGTAAHSSGAAAAGLPHFISYTPFAAQWVTLVLAAGSCPVSFVRGMLCQRHRASRIYDSTIITSRRGQFMFTDDSRRPAVMGVWIFKKVPSSLFCWAIFLFFIYLSVLIRRSVIRAYEAYTHRPSPKSHLLWFIVQRMQYNKVHKKRSSGVWVLLFN